MKVLFAILVLLVCAVSMPAQQHRLADSAQQKLNHIVQNGQAARPDPNPTVLTEDEINDYFAAGRVVLPQGVKKVSFKGQAGVVTTFAVVDFDEIMQGRHISNPLLSMFRGTHNVNIEANGAGTAGKGKVHVNTVTLDGFEVPKMALDYFVNTYIKPKYPNLGIDSEFQLPNKIDAATIGYHKLTVTQK